MINDIASPRRATARNPLVALDFGPNNSFGTIIFLGDGRQLFTKDYLSKLFTLSLYMPPP
jgi:hypothetical protein